MSKFVFILVLVALVAFTSAQVNVVPAPDDNKVNVVDGVNVVNGEDQVNVVDGPSGPQPRGGNK